MSQWPGKDSYLGDEDQDGHQARESTLSLWT